MLNQKYSLIERWGSDCNCQFKKKKVKVIFRVLHTEIWKWKYTYCILESESTAWIWGANDWNYQFYCPKNGIQYIEKSKFSTFKSDSSEQIYFTLKSECMAWLNGVNDCNYQLNWPKNGNQWQYIEKWALRLHIEKWKYIHIIMES